MRSSFLILAAVALTLGGCGHSDEQTDDDGKLRVVCTTGHVGDMLQNLGGEHVAVETLMGPGVDPHLYKPTPGDRRLLNAADVVFYSGLHLEGRLADLLEKLAEQKRVVAVTDRLRREHEDQLQKPAGGQGVHDPHVWFDVSLWARCAEYAAEKLIEADPRHAADYRRNADRYVAELESLHREVKDRLARIPKDRRVLVTAHDAFGYFGRAYDVEVEALQGISTADEADLGAVNRLVDLLVSRKIKAVFVESSVPAKNVEALVQGCRARGHEVGIGGELYSDALGPADTPEATYVGVVRANVRTIVAALE